MDEVVVIIRWPYETWCELISEAFPLWVWVCRTLISWPMLLLDFVPFFLSFFGIRPFQDDYAATSWYLPDNVVSTSTAEVTLDLGCTI